tara:strand:+ start:41823 stop:42026 length:204 start_codon:yes stop_codon:yes gene_type:complete
MVMVSPSVWEKAAFSASVTEIACLVLEQLAKNKRNITVTAMVKIVFFIAYIISIVINIIRISNGLPG